MVVMRRAPREHLGSEVLVLDADQEQVLAVRAPVVRVLGAPGTGKSTVAVEVVADRVGTGVAADACLILAPTRLAAARLREAVTTRLGGTSTDPLARTPAAFACSTRTSMASRSRLPPATRTPPVRMTSAGSTTATMAAIPTAKRSANWQRISCSTRSKRLAAPPAAPLPSLWPSMATILAAWSFE